MPQDSYHEVGTLIVAGTLVYLALAGVIVFVLFFYQRKRYQHKAQLLQLQQQYTEALLQSQLETQEATLQQVSEELHDNIGQLLSSTKMLLGVTGLHLHNAPGTFIKAEETLGKAIQDLRALSKSFNKEWLRQFNIVDNLQSEADRINASGTISLRYTTATRLLPMPGEAQIILFRIVQEALQNSIKHAHAHHIDVETWLDEAHITITVTDDGIGIPHTNGARSGVGIMNMQHRTHLLGGTIAWCALPVQGTQVRITLPTQTQTI